MRKYKVPLQKKKKKNQCVEGTEGKSVWLACGLNGNVVGDDVKDLTLCGMFFSQGKEFDYYSKYTRKPQRHFN